jgi:hypothetical protein
MEPACVCAAEVKFATVQKSLERTISVLRQ